MVDNKHSGETKGRRRNDNGKPTMKKENEECNSVSAALSLLVRESLEIVKHSLQILARVVLFVLNAVRHMWMVSKLNWNKKKQENLDERLFVPGHIIAYVGEWKNRPDWSLCDGTDGRPDLRHHKETPFHEKYYIYKWNEFKLKQEIEKGTEMNMNDFAKKVTLKEGGKVSISIAQVKEVLKIVNDMLQGELYKLVRKMK